VLKKIAVLDVVVLASFYALRLFAGSLAISVPISHWLLAFSMFIFLSLAFAKRFSELYSLRGRNEEKAKGRGYYASDLEQVAQLGSSSGYISALVMALYLNSSEVAKLYSNPKLLWLICPLLLYWIGRIWILAHRGQLHEDPIVFALKDRVSYIVGAVTLAIILIAI
jgi:4-hydroxybenzoate polyprenyltransferase